MEFSEEINFITSNRNIGRRDYFGWKDEGLPTYIKWASTFQYLLKVVEDGKITGLAIAYPIERDCKCMEDLYMFGNIVKKEDEPNKSLFVLDWLATTTSARKELVNKFKSRYPNWENQKKFGIQFNKLKLLSNKYINLLNTI
jgi:hypothetical protein